MDDLLAVYMILGFMCALLIGMPVGIGIALSLARAGTDVAINDIAPDTAEATAAEVAALDRLALAVQADVSQAEDVQAMIDRVVEELAHRG